MKLPKPDYSLSQFGTLIEGAPIRMTHMVRIHFAQCVRLDTLGTVRDGEYRLVEKDCWLYEVPPSESSDWKPEFMVFCTSPPMKTSCCPTQQEAINEMEYALMKLSECELSEKGERCG